MTTKTFSPQHSVCPACGHRIIRATLADGREIAIDDGARAYRLILDVDTWTYTAEPSGARPVHLCRGKE